jgi:hypothetical protein
VLNITRSSPGEHDYVRRDGLRYRCRNPHCRMKLPEPVENEHHAFCTPGCHASFYRSRCLVCEEPLRRKGDRQKFGSGHVVCRTEYHRFPRAYDHPNRVQTGRPTSIVREGGGSAHSTGLKIGLEGDRPPLGCLARHYWGGDPDHGDHSLYDKDGLTVARLVLADDGLYRLRSPVAWPRMSWSDLNEAKRRAETLALAMISTNPPKAKRSAAFLSKCSNVRL